MKQIFTLNRTALSRATWPMYYYAIQIKGKPDTALSSLKSKVVDILSSVAETYWCMELTFPNPL